MSLVFSGAHLQWWLVEVKVTSQTAVLRVFCTPASILAECLTGSPFPGQREAGPGSWFSELYPSDSPALPIEKEYLPEGPFAS